MQRVEQRFTRLEFTEALRAEAARVNVRMDERTLDAFTEDVFTTARGLRCHALLTSTFGTFAVSFIDELRYVARMNATERAHAARVAIRHDMGRIGQ
jgi:hypothetical protein